ncbi:MAG: M20 family metallopeptidase [Planctomycetota bacterium]
MPAAAWMLDRLEALCAADTTTGHEDRGLPALEALLRELGADVERLQVEPGRTNVWASWSARPRLLFSTHLDTVPPYLPPTRSGDLLHGRGACDAKGQVVAQLHAIRALLDRGVTDVAWLGVVGEETDSIGARKALALQERCRDLCAVIDGEPTENVLATGQRGTLHLELRTHGVPAHSGMPELGRSALWDLFDWLQRLRQQPVRCDPELGPEIWNLGLMHGGAAPNVIAPEASAEVFVRTLPGCAFQDLARRLAPDGAEVRLLGECEPDRYPALPGFAHCTVPFGSDAPRLRQLVPDRTVVLAGPGSITVAHTQDERITGAELDAGAALLLRVADALLARAGHA